MLRPLRRFGVFAALMFIIGPVLAHFEIVAPLAGFVAFALAGLIGIITVIMGIIAALRVPPADRQLV